MQCLNSPSRAEIDKAHREGTWLDVGLPSVSNIWKILGYRRVLWWALALSTIPLHLLWNSAVFVSLSSHEYAAWSVPSDYLQIVNTNTSIESLKSKYFPPPAVSPSGTQSNYSGIFDNETYTSPSATTNETLYHQPLDQWPDDIIEDFLNISKQIRNNIQGFEKLSRQECLRKYVGPIISNRADVLLVSSNESTLWRQRLLIDRFDVDFSTYSTYDSTGAGAWICNDTDRGVTGYECDLQGAASKVDSSVFANEDIVSCYSLWAEEHCKLQFSAIIMVIVTVCNFIKLLCMTYVAWRRDAEPLITLGDAISSFLRREDTTTKGACLAGQAYFQQERRIRRLKTVSTFLKSPCNQIKCDWGLGNDGVHIRSPVLWKPIRRRRFATASGFRWAWCIGLCITAISAAGVLLGMGVNTGNLPSTTIAYLYSMGFGTVTPDSIIQGIQISDSSGLILLVLLSNSPQLVLSFLYLSYNSLFTSMLLAQEWNGYATRRKPLRVTSATGHQRSTYWLQLPYRYSVPLLIASAVLHWLVSQSLFLARVTVLDRQGAEDPKQSISTCGYSNIAIIFVIILGSLLVFIVLVHGFRRFHSRMPLGSSCSAAISAACHPSEMDTDAALKPVRWGEVKSYENDGQKEGIRHCSFTSFEVIEPAEGEPYA